MRQQKTVTTGFWPTITQARCRWSHRACYSCQWKWNSSNSQGMLWRLITVRTARIVTEVDSAGQQTLLAEAVRCRCLERHGRRAKVDRQLRLQPAPLRRRTGSAARPLPLSSHGRCCACPATTAGSRQRPKARERATSASALAIARLSKLARDHCVHVQLPEMASGTARCASRRRRKRRHLLLLNRARSLTSTLPNQPARAKRKAP